MLLSENVNEWYSLICINIDDNRLCTNQCYRNRDFLSYFEAYFLAQHVIINDPYYHSIWIYFISIDELIIKIKQIRKIWWIYHIYTEHTCIVKVEALYLIPIANSFCVNSKIIWILCLLQTSWQTYYTLFRV